MRIHLLHLFSLLLSLGSVHASLPYSIPDLGRGHIAYREASVGTASLFRPTQPASGPSYTLTQTASTYALSSDNHDWTETAPFPVPPNSTLHRSGTTGVTSTAPSTSTSETHSWTDTAPFPVPFNTSTVQSRTIIFSASVSLTAATSISTESSSFNTTSFSRVSSLIRSSTNLGSTSTSTSDTITSSLSSISGTIVDNNPVILTTVTGSDGSPRVITITVPASASASTMSDSPSGPGDFPFSRSNVPNQPAPTGPGGPSFGPSDQPGQPIPSSPPDGAPIPPGQPSPTSPSDNIPSPGKAPTPYVFDAVVDGEVYHLPSPQEPPISILLLDGSLGQIFSNKVILRGQTLEIPAGLSASQVISSGGESITAQPGESKKPDPQRGGDGGGGKGLFGALGGLIGAAGSAAGSIANAGKGALDLASGGAGAVADSLSGAFQSAVNDVGGFVSSLNGIQQAFPLDQLSQAGLSSVLKAQNLGRDASNWAKSMGKMVQGFDSLSPAIQQQVRDNIKQHAGAGGSLGQAEQAMRAFKDFPWSSEGLPTQSLAATNTPPQTNPPTNTASVQESQGLSSTHIQSATTTYTPTQTSTTNTASAAATTSGSVHYFIRTKAGTSLETFEKFIKELDGAVGEAHTYDMKHVDHQVYMTELDPTQVADIQKNYDFITIMFPMIFRASDLDARDEHHVLPSGYTNNLARIETNSNSSIDNTTISKLRSRAMNPDFPNASYWKKMISTEPPPQRDSELFGRFLDDDSGGKGTTVYVLDDGFDTNIQDLQPEGRSVGEFFVANNLAFTPSFLVELRRVFPNARIVDQSINGGFHGTKMATIAAGKIHGIAPNADLYLVKTKGQYNKGIQGSNDVSYALQPQAVQKALDHVRDHVEGRRQADPTAKSVINMSWGVPLSEQRGQDMETMFDEFFQWCEAVGISVVMSAGNDPELPLHLGVPQKFGTTTNRIITVGAVQQDGSLWPNTAPHIPGHDGSMTVFAPGVDIIVPGVDSRLNVGTFFNTGTSQATAIVSGLAAYLYSLPPLTIIPHPTIPSPEDNVKQFIAAHAWTRVPKSAFANPPPGWPSIANLNVVYNLANGDDIHSPNSCVFKRANGSDVPCSSSSVPSSTLATSIRSSSVPSSYLSSFASPSVTIVPSQAPSSTIFASSTPTSTPAPVSEKCRITVAEFDDPNPDNHDKETWSIKVFPASASNLTNSTPICFRGATEDDGTGVDVKCPPIGDGPLGFVNVRREDGDVLRFIWGEKTWTGSDEQCTLLKDWHPSEFNAEQRKRETECTFACHIDESEPPFYDLSD